MSNENQPQNRNQRVTLAVLQRDVHAVQDDVQSLRADVVRVLDNYGERIRSLEMNNARRETQEGVSVRDIDALKAQSRTWNIINSVGAILAGLVGYFR